MQYVWLAVLILLVIAEAMTVGLVSIWFAGGSLIAMFVAMAGAGIGWQIGVFLLVSFLLLIATRPLAVKYLNNKKEKTNYESVIGNVTKVTEKIDNYNNSGVVYTDGKEWTARAVEDGMVIEAGTLVTVVAVEGVKLIVKPYEENRQE